MEDLQQLREQIDSIDGIIIELLAQRFLLVKKIGIYKKMNNLVALDTIRRNKLLQSHIEKGKEKGLSESLIINVWKSIHNESLHLQQ